MPAHDQLFTDLHAATMAGGGAYGLIEDAAIAVQGGQGCLGWTAGRSAC